MSDQKDDTDTGSVSRSASCAARNAGRLDALRQKFERNADRCQEQERYEAMDAWRDAAADIAQLQGSMEAPRGEAVSRGEAPRKR